MARSVSKKTTATTGLDINILSNITLNKTVAVKAGFDAQSTKASGLQKVANMFYKTLFTQLGSNPLDKTEGTDLVSVFQSNLADRDVLFAFVSKEVEAGFQQIKTFQERSNAPVTEQLAGVRITSFLFDASKQSLTFGVNIFNVNGDETTLQIPSIVIT